MKRTPRFEIVRTDAGHHARFVAGNGRIVWTTEVYASRRRTFEAIELITGAKPYEVQGAWFITHLLRTVEVRLVDERTVAP
jgi:uncharacterized protein YegP (UPF0339 family)